MRLLTETTNDGRGSRLDFLDGLRGLAAFYVVVHHVVLTFCGELPRHDPATLGWARWLIKGHYAVAVFIVLSGFCLMSPVVHAGGELRGGLWCYIKRRALRILPPYYAAMGVCLLVIAFVPTMSTRDGVFWSMSLPAFTTGSILSHLLVIHNLNPNWAFKIDSPMWSVATEWQIYFVFPLVFLPVWRRWGTPAALVSGLAIGVGLHLSRGFLPLILTQACPWYIALFAFGMASAAICFERTRSRFGERLIRAAPCAAGAMCLAILGLMAVTSLDERKLMPFDLAVGAATGCLLITAARVPGPRRIGWTRGFLQFRPLVALGQFSYSVYLIHCPVIVVLYRTTTIGHVGSPGLGLPMLLAVAVPAAILCGYLFYLAFEKPFLHRSTRAPWQQSLFGAVNAAVSNISVAHETV